MLNQDLELTSIKLLSEPENNFHKEEFSHYRSISTTLSDSGLKNSDFQLESENNSESEIETTQMVKSYLYGKSIQAIRVPLLPFFLIIVINKLVFHRVTILFFDEDRQKFHKIDSKIKWNKYNAYLEFDRIIQALKEKNLQENPSLFHKLLSCEASRFQTQKYLKTFGDDFSESEINMLNRKHRNIIKAALAPSRKNSFVLLLMKKPHQYETFLLMYDECSDRRYKFSPKEPLDSTFSGALTKFETYRNSFDIGFGFEVYPLYNLWTSDFMTDCMKFQDITDFVLEHDRPPLLKHGDILLFEVSVARFDARVVLEDDEGNYTFVKFRESDSGAIEAIQTKDWSHFIGDKGKISYVLRMFSLIPYDKNIGAWDRLENTRSYSGRYLWFNRVFHRTPAEFIAFGHCSKVKSPRAPSLLKRILRFAFENTFGRLINKLDGDFRNVYL